MFTFQSYILKNNGVSLAGAVSAAQLKAGTNGAVAILRHSLTQSGSVTSTQVGMTLQRKTAAATVTTAVAGTTLLKQNGNAPTTDASLGTSATGITASAEGTNGEQTLSRGFNVLNGQETVYTPEERVIVPQGGIIAQTLLTAFNSTWFSELVFMELRGA
jgi:type IV secretory pathway VirB10-like protein